MPPSRLFPQRYYGTCCVVPHCSMRRGTNSLSKIRTFKIPRSLERRAAWLKAINRQDWYPSDNSAICSQHFVKGCPSKDPNDPDFVPSIFPSEKKSVKLEKPKPLKKSIQKHRGQKGNEDNTGSSEKKTKPKPKKPVDSESSSTDENAEDNMDIVSDPDVDDPASAPLSSPRLPSIPEKEFVLVGKRTVDVNYFVSCLRRANEHHNSDMSCGFSDMIICEEKVKNSQDGIVIRCKVCLLRYFVWLENPLATQAATTTTQVTKTVPKLPISRNPKGNLPVKKKAPVIVQSHVPLFGCPQVAPVQQTFLSKSSASSSFTDSSIVEMSFCVEEPTTKQDNSSAKWTAVPPKRRTSTRIALSPRTISKRRAEYITPNSSAATLSKRPCSTVPQSVLGVNSDPGRVTSIPGSIPDTSNLQTQLKRAVLKRTVLTPGNLQKIMSLSNSLSGQITTAALVPQRILLDPQFQSVQPASDTASASGSISILLPPKILVSSSQSTSAQSVGSKSSSSVCATITPNTSTTDVLPVDLNLVKKEKIETVSGQPSVTLSPATIVPETITPDVAEYLPVNLNLVKKEKNETESVQPFVTFSPATIVPETITPDVSDTLPVNSNLVKKEIE